METTIYKDSINRLYDSIVWTHKIQRTYLEILEKRRKIISIIKIALLSVSSITTSIFAIFDCFTCTIIFSFVTLLSLFVSEILDKIETKENIDKLNVSSNNLFQLRNDLMIFIDEIKSEKIDEKIIKTKLDCINVIYSNIQKDTPSIPDYCVTIAEKKIKNRKDEENNFNLL